MPPDRLAEIPQGYVWKECPAIRAKFPMPETWFFKEENVPGTRAFFMSREQVSPSLQYLVGTGSVKLLTSDPETHFKTGLSINTFFDFDRGHGMKPSQAARGYMERHLGMMIPESSTTSKREGPLRTLRRLFRVDAGRVQGIVAEPTHFYFDLTANDRTGSLYIINFETPSYKWEEDKEIAAIMVEQRILDWGV